MDWRIPVGVFAVLTVVASLVGVVASLALHNDLLTAAAVQAAALATLAVVAVSLVLFALIGGPSQKWRRTPYW